MPSATVGAPVSLSQGRLSVPNVLDAGRAGRRHPSDGGDSADRAPIGLDDAREASSQGIG